MLGQPVGEAGQAHAPAVGLDRECVGDAPVGVGMVVAEGLAVAATATRSPPARLTIRSTTTWLGKPPKATSWLIGPS